VPTEDVIDPVVVADLRRAQDAFGNPTFIRQLVDLFLSNTPGKMARIRQALAAGDSEGVGQVAHALRSNCGMLGAAQLAGAFVRMEEAAARGDLAAAASAFETAEEQLPGVLEALAKLTDQPPAPSP
jgi:HPt (histidine-containing phosphotransfer) domain-containing protein